MKRQLFVGASFVEYRGVRSVPEPLGCDRGSNGKKSLVAGPEKRYVESRRRTVPLSRLAINLLLPARRPQPLQWPMDRRIIDGQCMNHAPSICRPITDRSNQIQDKLLYFPITSGLPC